MKNKLTKIIAGVVLCFAFVSMPLLLSGCGKKEKKEDTQSSVCNECVIKPVTIGDLSFNLISFERTNNKFEINLVIENFSDSSVGISGDSFMISPKSIYQAQLPSKVCRGSESDLIVVKAKGILSYQINIDVNDSIYTEGDKLYLYLGSHLLGQLGHDITKSSMSMH